MKLQEVADYLNKLLSRRPEYGRDEIDGIRIDKGKVAIQFKTRLVNPLKEEARQRERQAEMQRKLRELSEPDKCHCEQPKDGELIGAERRGGAPYVEYIDVNIYRCKKCGKQFDDAPAIA